MSDDSGEKNFAPTPKRRRDAAEKGDVLRSKEMATAIAIIIGAGWLRLAGPWLLEGLENVARSSFRFNRSDIEDFSPFNSITAAMQDLLPPIFVLGLLVMGSVVASQLFSPDGRFVVKNMAPKGSRINPLSGLKRMFGPTGWIELGKGLAKLALLGSIAWWWGQANVSRLLALGRGELHGQLGAAWHAAMELLFLLAAGLVLIALVDLPIQMIRRLGRLKMSHKDMRDETKQSEGSPEQRAAQRSRQRELAKGGVRSAVKDAQFVLTNPTHFAVAMAYDPAIAPAPVVVAKGRGEKALAIRELASEYNIPTLEYPALARSVYFTTREAQVIRAELYAAVAAVLAFVFSVKRGEKPLRPRVDVPLELRFDANGNAHVSSAGPK